MASSDATSNKPQPPKKKNDLSEADFLADQQTKAKAAMDTAMADMKRAISNAFKDNAHVTAWMGPIRGYRWESAAAGFPRRQR